MPRKPIDGNPSGLRIDLGGKEREILESFATSYRIQSIAPALVDLLSDASALYVVLSAYEIITGNDIPGLINPSELNGTVKAFVDHLKLQQTPEIRAERASSFVGGLQNIADLLFGSLLNPTQYGGQWTDFNGE